MKIFYSEKHKDHFAENHPERPERVETLKTFLSQKGHQILTPSEKIDIDLLKTIHSPSMIDRLFDLSRKIDHTIWIDSDTYFTKDTLEAALQALSCAQSCVKTAIEEKIPCLALTRPPGHHSEPSSAMGFCIFNNVAYAVEWALKTYSLDRALIFDFDIHHGNGTEKIFYQRSDVLYISIHQHPLYPMTGTPDRIGEGPGEGYNINIPVGLLASTPQVEEKLLPFKDFIHEYKPDLLAFSAGFDGHRLDPLSGTTYEAETFSFMTDFMINCCESSDLRIFSVLEGGYHLKALCESVSAHLESLSGS